MTTFLAICAATLLVIFFELLLIGVSLSKQLEQQHRELIAMIDSLATMVGEAIDQHKERK